MFLVVVGIPNKGRNADSNAKDNQWTGMIYDLTGHGMLLEATRLNRSTSQSQP